MKDGTEAQSGVRDHFADATLRHVAEASVSALLTDDAFLHDSRATRRVNALCDAFMAEDNALRHDAIQRLQQEGIGIDDLMDYVIPATARALGERWMNDEISFAMTSIGAARLQETVRALAARRAAAATAPTKSILLVVPKPETHTLGVFVAADQFRRLGFQVEVAVDQHPRQIAALLRKHRFAMVGITAAGRRTLASTRELVDIIRATAIRVVPVVIGGPVLDTGIDVLKTTGANYIARDAQTALHKCGLTTKPGALSPIRTTDHVD